MLSVYVLNKTVLGYGNEHLINKGRSMGRRQRIERSLKRRVVVKNH